MRLHKITNTYKPLESDELPISDDLINEGPTPFTMSQDQMRDYMEI